MRSWITRGHMGLAFFLLNTKNRSLPSVPHYPRVSCPSVPAFLPVGLECVRDSRIRKEHTVTPEQRKDEIEIMLRRARNWPDLRFEMERVSNVHWVLRGPHGFWPPEIHLGPRGGMDIEEFRSYSSTMRDGSGGALTALLERARWDR
jgi:hypothetical protein